MGRIGGDGGRQFLAGGFKLVGQGFTGAGDFDGAGFVDGRRMAHQLQLRGDRPVAPFLDGSADGVELGQQGLVAMRIGDRLLQQLVETFAIGLVVARIFRTAGNQQAAYSGLHLGGDGQGGVDRACLALGCVADGVGAVDAGGQHDRDDARNHDHEPQQREGDDELLGNG